MLIIAVINLLAFVVGQYIVVPHATAFGLRLLHSWDNLVRLRWAQFLIVLEYPVRARIDKAVAVR